MATAPLRRSAAPLSLPLALLLALPLGAAAQTPEPGVWWESTIQMEMKGFSMPAQTLRVCLPKKGLAQPPVTPNQGEECRVEQFKRSGNKMTWKVRCEGEEPMSGEGEMVQTATSYDGRVTMRTADGEIPMKMKGRLVGGDCDAKALARENAARRKEAEALHAQTQAQAQAQQAAMCESWVEGMNASLILMPNGMCSDPRYKARFCARLSSLDGYLASSAQGEQELQRAGAACGTELRALRTSLCSAAGKEAEGASASTKTLQFLGENCPAESKVIAQKQCAGRGYSGVEGSYGEFCSQYAREMLGRDVQPAAGKAPQRSVQDEAVEGGKKALKGLLGF